MNDAEETIEKVLTGLRVAEPSPGLHRRILQAMEARETVPSAAPWRLAALATVCAMVMAACWFVTITVRRDAPVAIKHTTPVNARQTPAPMTPRPVRASKHMPVVKPLVVSYPAPPMPLTEQEKLLLRLAHRRDEKNMALLNPEVRAAQTAKATAQFQQFFDIDPKEMRSQIE